MKNKGSCYIYNDLIRGRFLQLAYVLSHLSNCMCSACKLWAAKTDICSAKQHNHSFSIFFFSLFFFAYLLCIVSHLPSHKTGSQVWSYGCLLVSHCRQSCGYYPRTTCFTDLRIVKDRDRLIRLVRSINQPVKSLSVFIMQLYTTLLLMGEVIMAALATLEQWQICIFEACEKSRAAADLPTIAYGSTMCYLMRDLLTQTTKCVAHLRSHGRGVFCVCCMQVNSIKEGGLIPS